MHDRERLNIVEIYEVFMNIVILGAGTVGTSIAELLCANRHNVILVDPSRQALEIVEDHLDVQSVVGSACDAATLFHAGVQSADLCLSVTSGDEINLVGASLAKSMGATRSIARIFNPTYRDASTFDYQRHFGIDRLLSLEHLTALELAKAIRKRGLFAVENFARGGIEVQELAVEADAKTSGVPLRDLKFPPGVRVGLISNGHKTYIPSGDDVLAAGDHVTLIGQRETLEDVRNLFQHKTESKMSVIIAGGGAIGYNLARILQGQRFNVSLLEADEQRCHYLADRLSETTVLHDDATRLSVLREARVGKADVFVAAMGHDEDNIMCGIEALEIGAPRIMSVIRRPDYANVVQKLGIDKAVSPREVMAQQVLGMVQAGPILARTELAGGVAEAWELDVPPKAEILKAKLKDLNLPQQCLIAAIVREDYVRVPGAEDQVQAGDTLVVLVQKESIDQTLKLFLAP